jgi:NADH-quinone oxidoreductase subunit H
MVAEWYLNLHPAWQALFRVLVFVLPTLMLVPMVIWYERRLLGWFQDRFGPNRAGPFGLLQPIADGAKLMFKEDITPGHVDRFIYILAPVLALFPAFALGATIPWGPFPTLTPIADIDVGILYIFAVASLAVYGLVLAGYASNNKYSLMGGLRASAQLISYELGLGMALASMVLAAGTLRPVSMVAAQMGPNDLFAGLGLDQVARYVANWHVLTPYGVVAAIVFFICMIAELDRAPFDLPEAENELIAGYHTEYSSFKFASFFMGEYAAMVVWSAIFSTVFLGGYYLLPIRFDEIQGGVGIWGTLHALNGASALAPLWLLLKVGFCLTMIIWLRATLPRMRYDQLMSLGWKSLLPIAVANLILVAVWIVASRLGAERGPGIWLGWAVYGGAAVLLWMLYVGLNRLNQPVREERRLASRTITLVNEPANRNEEEVSTAPGAP